MKFVIKHPTKPNVYLRKPRFVGDTVQWTEPKGTPLSTREPWLFATRDGATKARNMHALDASVEPWYEAGDTAEPKHYSPSNMQRWRDCPSSYSTAVEPTPQYNNAMQDYMLAAVLADLLIVSSDF